MSVGKFFTNEGHLCQEHLHAEYASMVRTSTLSKGVHGCVQNRETSQFSAALEAKVLHQVEDLQKEFYQSKKKD